MHKIFAQIFIFSSPCSLWKVSFRIAMNFFSGHFGEEGGRFISKKPLKQVFSVTSLRGFLWVFKVVPTVFIWVFMWILIISCKKLEYFTFRTWILPWKLVKIQFWRIKFSPFCDPKCFNCSAICGHQTWNMQAFYNWLSKFT